jgi:hypothetical protein
MVRPKNKDTHFETVPVAEVLRKTKPDETPQKPAVEKTREKDDPYTIHLMRPTYERRAAGNAASYGSSQWG